MPELPLVSPFGPEVSKADAADLAAVLKAIANPARLRILHLLHVHGPLTSVDLQAHIGLSQPTTSHHLHVLMTARLVEAAPSDGNGSLKPRRLSPGAIRSVRDALTSGRRR
jgi:ArsR family transcriptional regulator